MVIKKISFDFEEINSLEELEPVKKELVLRAIEAAKHAYAPYSKFNVGASALLENGKILTGSNQENAAYPSGLCAERVVLFHAGSDHPGVKVVGLAVAALKDGMPVSQPVSPCGGCRQVMQETEMRFSHPMEVILYGSEKTRIIRSASDLLPFPFKF